MLDEMKDFEIEATYIASNIKNLMQNFKIYEDGKFRNLKYKRYSYTFKKYEK